MIRLDAATFLLLQWAVGGLLFTWSPPAGGRSAPATAGSCGAPALFALASVVVGQVVGPVPVRDVAALGVVAAAAAALVVSVQRRSAGVAGQREVVERRSARVAAMTGIDREEQRFTPTPRSSRPRSTWWRRPSAWWAWWRRASTPASPAWLSVLRLLVGAAFLGAVTDAMLLATGTSCSPVSPASAARAGAVDGVDLAVEVAVFLIPVGMVSVLNGTIDDDYGGILGWMWVTCAVTTIGLVLVTRAALKERQYSAVMAATGLLYLAILTAFGTDLVARALLA
ncbi:MAG: hypothetical protein R2746_05270 [Acidimicrobiales bacterium]